jgi:hypothetical protein
MFDCCYLSLWKQYFILMNSVIKKMSILCVSVIGVHLYHSQVQNPVGITAVGYIQLYRNLMCVCE